MGNAGRVHYAVAFALSLGLTAPATAKPKPPKEVIAPRPITPAEREAVKAAIKDLMLDPSSVQFKWTPNVHDGRIYCAQFNGKNKFGGYTGFSPFMVHISTDANGAPAVKISRIGTNNSPRDLSAMVTRANCENAGVDWSGPSEFEG